MNQNNLNVLVVQFTNELKQTNIPYFRGAVIAALGEQADVLFIIIPKTDFVMHIR